jgi:hypothetical protein
VKLIDGKVVGIGTGPSYIPTIHDEDDNLIDVKLSFVFPNGRVVYAQNAILFTNAPCLFWPWELEDDYNRELSAISPDIGSAADGTVVMYKDMFLARKGRFWIEIDAPPPASGGQDGAMQN